MVAHALSQKGMVVGMATTDGIYIGGELVVEGDTTGPISAQTVLSDPSVEIAVLETARGGIVRGGLGYDWSDISVISNVRLDHVGQDGIGPSTTCSISRRWSRNVFARGDADPQRGRRAPGSTGRRRIGRQAEEKIVYFSMRPPHVLISGCCTRADRLISTRTGGSSSPWAATRRAWLPPTSP